MLIFMLGVYTVPTKRFDFSSNLTEALGTEIDILAPRSDLFLNFVALKCKF